MTTPSTHAHTHTNTYTAHTSSLSLPFSLSLSLSLSLSHTHTHSLSLTHTHSLSLSNTHARTHARTHAHTHTHTHTHTHKFQRLSSCFISPVQRRSMAMQTVHYTVSPCQQYCQVYQLIIIITLVGICISYITPSHTKNTAGFLSEQ